MGEPVHGRPLRGAELPRPAGFRTRAAAALLVALSGLCGCTIAQFDFQSLPPREQFQSIQPGVTTRSEVLTRLGPPEEIRRPAPFERVRPDPPQHRRILEEEDIFGRRAYTYVSGQRRTESLGLPPFGPPLLRVRRSRSTEQRWRIEFDDEDVVQSVSYVDERGEDE
jgi:outer membrane protein assembly factor BamE (lipoprotein component of BamABCDE complex)